MTIDDGGDALLRMARVDFGGAVRDISLAYVPEATVGDWVNVHVGMAIAVLAPEEADAVLADLEQLAALQADPEAGR